MAGQSPALFARLKRRGGDRLPGVSHPRHRLQGEGRTGRILVRAGISTQLESVRGGAALPSLPPDLYSCLFRTILLLIKSTAVVKFCVSVLSGSLRGQTCDPALRQAAGRSAWPPLLTQLNCKERHRNRCRNHFMIPASAFVNISTYSTISPPLIANPPSHLRYGIAAKKPITTFKTPPFYIIYGFTSHHHPSCIPSKLRPFAASPLIPKNWNLRIVSNLV